MTVGLKRLPAHFYRLASGREPVREWLKALDRADRRIVGEDIKDVEYRMATRNAAGAQSRPRAVGGAKRAHPRKDRQGDIHCGPRVHGAAARVRQEDAGHAQGRPGTGAAPAGRRMKKAQIGSSLDNWLRDEGISSRPPLGPSSACWPASYRAP